MKELTRIHFGGFLKDNIALVLSKEMEEVQNEQEAEDWLEDTYDRYFYHVDFYNIQSSVNNFSENFIKEHYIDYEEDLFSMMFRSEYELCDFRFGKDLGRRLSNTFRLGLNQTTFELTPHSIDIVGIYPDIKNNINMIEEFMESNSYFPVKYKSVAGPKDTHWKVVKFTTTQKNEYVDVYKGDFVYYIAPQINREFIEKYGIRREMIDNTYDTPHRIYAFTKDISVEDAYEKYVRITEYVCKKYTHDIYKIDIRNLDNVFYEHDFYYHVVFTYKSIPKECIIQRMPLN